MSFGYGVGDFIAISALAAKVYTAYKDAPSDYKNIAEEVKSLQGIINKAAQHFTSTTLSNNDLRTGQEALKGCQSVLDDLNSLIEEYKSLASTHKRLIFKRVKLGTEDIATLRARLTSNATLLSSFIRRFDISTIKDVVPYANIYLSCEFLEIQAQLTDVLGLHRTNSRVSVTSIASFADTTNTRMAYKQFCKNLYQIGITEDMILEKEQEILEILRSQGTVASGQIGGSNIGDQCQLLRASSLHMPSY